MSTGGQYQLIANDGPQDILLTANELLTKRLEEIHRLRCKHPAIRDPTPTLVDVERTHLLFINSHFKPFVTIGLEYTKIGPDQGNVTFGQELIYSIPQYGDFFADMVLHFTMTGFQATAGNQCFCADFIGHRMVQRARFEVNQSFLDQYDYDIYNFHYNFTVTEDRKRSWLRMVGQEVPTPAYLTQSPTDEYREVKMIVNGYQTPKAAHPVIDLWVPLLFWFNKDARLAIPSLAIPYGQRFIKILLATPELLFGATPAPGGYITPVITNADLYINNIFVNPDILDLFIKRIGFALIRVHRYQKNIVNVNQDSIKLDQLKFPVETIYFGCRMQANYASLQDWYRFSLVIPQFISYPVSVANPAPPPLHLQQFANAEWKQEVRILDTALFQTKGVILYREFPTEFHNKYLPYISAIGAIRSPDQEHMYMATFSFFTGIYQPSGHINLSRTREFYIQYSSSVLSVIAPGELTVIAVCINFLLIAEGQAALRYNT